MRVVQFPYWRLASKMASSQIFTPDSLIRDLIGVHVEKTLLSRDIAIYDKVVQMLDEGNIAFSDCCAYPAILNAILRQLYGSEHESVVQDIKKKLHDFEDQKGVAWFLEILSL